MAVAAGILSSTTATPDPDIPKRPYLEPSPYNSGKDLPCSPPRDEGRYCFVKPDCSHKRDDAPRILKAFQRCNDGGTVVLDKSYLISSPLDLTFLKHIDVVVTGEIHFNDDDVYYWAEHSFKYAFQNQSVYWKWGGEDVNIYGDLSNGKSLIDGHGQLFWEEGRANKTVRSRSAEKVSTEADDEVLQFLRPMLFAFDGMKGATMSNLRMRNPPHVSCP